MRRKFHKRFGVPSWMSRLKLQLQRKWHSLKQWQRVVCATLAGVMLLAAVIPTAQFIIVSRSYILNDQVRQLVGKPNKNLSAKITYNSEQKSWQFNQGDIPIGSGNGTSGVQQADMPSTNDLKAQVGGGGEKDKSLYAVDMPGKGAQGVTYYDTNTDLSFGLVPKFSVGEGRQIDGHLVYPSDRGTKLIYTAKANGMKEDIILMKPIGDELEFAYDLKLPDTLEAKIQSDGSLGVFSPDPVLFGNISFGDGQDKEKILSARKTAAKDHLLFLLPAPVIIEAGGKQANAPARFVLNGTTLTVEATGLEKLNYPLSIDPSVVVTSSGDFGTGNGDNIEYGTDQISRAKVTGGSLGAWGTTTGYSNGGIAGIGAAAVNGYLYAVGGNNSSTQESTAEYAPINTNGTTGSWSSTSNMTIPRTTHGFTAYNGYVYAVAGATTGGTSVSSVEYAPINSNGTLGSWSTTTSLSTATVSGVAVANDGYLYLLGGNTGSVINTVSYAAIKADGSLGSWSTTTSFTTARQSLNAFAYNDRMYVMGGSNGSSTYYNDVQSAPINSDGTIGTWVSTTSFTTARAGAYGGAYNGYAYIAGGTATAHSTNDAFGDTQYAQINADGTLGAWRTSTTLSAERFAGGTTMYNGQMYGVGGTESGSGTRSVQYASIDPAGVTGSYTSTTSLTATRHDHESVVYNGYLYVLGGTVAGSLSNSVIYAPINNDGTVGTWTATTSFTTARGRFATAVWNGYMYILGGDAGSRRNDVQYAPINSDGTVGTWTATTSFTTGRYTHKAAAWNGYVYIAGGNANSGNMNDVQYAPINSDGTVGTWTATTSFTTGRLGPGMEVYGGYMYIMGGSDGSSFNDVQYAPINSDGTVGTWTATTSFTTGRRYFGSAVANGYLYILGGTSGLRRSDVQYAPINSDGTLGAWATTTSLTSARSSQTAEFSNGNILVIGGNSGSSLSTVEYTPVNNGGSGVTSTWSQKTSGVGSALYDYGSLFHNGYFYIVGGDTSGSGTSSVTTTRYAPLNSDGTIGSWSTTSSLGSARHSHGTYIVDGYMYVVGGDSGGTALSSIEYASMNSNGTLGSWSTATGALATTVRQFAATSYNGYLYALGGTNGTLSTTVSYADPASGGDISSWSTTTALPYALRSGAALTYNGKLYVVGGIDGSGYTNKIIYASINSNGTLGSWQNAERLPVSGETAVVAANGHLYAIGVNDSSCSDAAYLATIHSDGSLSAFQKTSSAGACGEANGSATYTDGKVYFPTANGAISSAGMSSTARIGSYSKTVDLSSDYDLSTITYGGALPNERAHFKYQAASSSGVLGPLLSPFDLTGGGGGGVGCGGGVSSTRYVRLSTTFDDTVSSVYPDVSSSAATITDMTIDYTSSSSSAPPNLRMMHGKFFSSETIQPLDTCSS